MTAGPLEEFVEYPDSDGEPMADNTLQYEWIVLLRENLNGLFPDFVAGNLLWYPVRGEPRIRVAPDVLVALGRPKGYRGSYKQWEEEGIPPRVVFEVLSPGNTASEMIRKMAFYQKHGVEEYYVIDPDEGTASGHVRHGRTLQLVEDLSGHVSPLLGIRFQLAEGSIVVLGPDGAPFQSFEEVKRALDQERERADQERERADQERERAERLAAELEALKRQIGG